MDLFLMIQIGCVLNNNNEEAITETKTKRWDNIIVKMFKDNREVSVNI